MDYFVLLMMMLVASICKETAAFEDVRQPPSIINSPPSFIAYRTEQEIELKCSATGTPTPTYEWFKDQTPLNLNLHNIKHQGGGDITITSATSFDEGYYQCIASNQHGKDITNGTLMLRAYLGDSASATTIEKVVNEGEPFSIQFTPVKSFPKAQYRWASADSTISKDQNQQDLTRTNRMQWAENGDLYFAYARTDDSLGNKIYKGLAFNPLVDISTGGSYHKVTVNRVPGGVRPFPPTLAFSSANITVGLEGEPVTLRCFFNGYPDVQIQWTPPNNKFVHARHTIPNYKTEFKIASAVQSDAGEYVCRGSNTGGVFTHKLQLIVDAVPVFQSPADKPKNLNITEGESAVYQCKTYAKPKADITWMKNGVPLDPNNLPARFFISPDQTSLTVRSVCRDCQDRDSFTDLMVIQCNSSNIHGAAFSGGYLNVLKKTTVGLIGESKVVIEDDSQRTLQFQCISTSDPSTPSKVTWYKVISKDERHVVYPINNVITTGNGSLTITAGLNTNTSWSKVGGEYQCVASNNYSTASATTMIEVNIVDTPADLPVQQGMMDLWWILILIVIMLAILIIICCCCCLYRNRGDKYDVDNKERKNGNDPEKELLDSGFHDYQRQEVEPFKGSQNSLGSSARLFGEDSVSEIGDIGAQNRLLDNGSYHSAQYMNTVDRKKGRNEVL